jgi:nucleolar protein 9
MLLGAFELDTDEARQNALPIMLRLQPWSKYQQSRNDIRTAGSRLIQELFRFPSTSIAFLVGSILTIPTEDLVDLICHPIASYAMEAFMESTSIDLFLKRRILHTLKTHYHHLAADKFGSHLIDRAWTFADVKMKEIIGDELVEAYKELSSKPFGRIMLRNRRIELLKQNRREWLMREKGVDRKRRMFEEFLASQETKEEVAEDVNDGVKKSEKKKQSKSDGKVEKKTKDRKAKKEKKKTKGNEIDALFSETQSQSSLELPAKANSNFESDIAAPTNVPDDLVQVLEAIKDTKTSKAESKKRKKSDDEGKRAKKKNKNIKDDKVGK